MTLEMWVTLAILIGAIVLFVTEWLRVDVVALGVVVLLMVTGILTTSQALAGFSNSVVLIVASLFIVGGALQQTGLVTRVSERILIIAGRSEIRLTIVVMLAGGVLSAFMSNTGAVAVLLPAIVGLARTANVSPSKLLIPLSYAALLGGTATLIGTTPNIIVADMLREQGEETFHFFSFTPIGLLMMVAGIFFMVMVGRRILPGHKPVGAYEEQEHSLRELLDVYRLPDNLFRLRVPPESNLANQTLAGARLGESFGLMVLDIQRQPPPQAVVRFGEQQLILQPAIATVHPTPDTMLEANDVLIVQGEEMAVHKAVAYWNLAMQPVLPADEQALISQEAGIAEVLLPPRSSLIGKTLVNVRFGSTYKLTVLNLMRPGASGRLDLKTTPLQFGDILLVQGYWHDILALRRKSHDFLVMGRPEAMLGAPNRHRAPVALLILAAMLVALVVAPGEMAMISMAAGLLMVLGGCLSMDDAYEAIDWKSIVLIAGMLPMSTALQQVGLVARFAQSLTEGLGSFGPLVVMAGLFLLTAIITQVLSNTATAVVVAPIAFATARELGVHPQAFMMATCIAASMAFASPVGSPVNTLVMGAGGYRFADYIRAGVPMVLIMLVVTMLGIPLLWPF
ncbi:MAG: SLC13 family permease [Anaerolineae bacterium]|nr:SLC13 family permease [Anaerolineae bacterium]